MRSFTQDLSFPPFLHILQISPLQPQIDHFGPSIHSAGLSSLKRFSPKFCPSKPQISNFKPKIGPLRPSKSQNGPSQASNQPYKKLKSLSRA